MWWYGGGTGDGVIGPGGKVQLSGAGKAGRGRAGKRRFRERDVGMKAGGGEAPTTSNVTSLLAATVGPSSGFVAGLARVF